MGLSAAAPEKPARRPAAAGGPAAYERVLTEGQREVFREHLQAHARELRAGQLELAKLRRELQESVLNAKASASFIKEKTEAIAKLDAAQLRVRMAALSQIAPTLTEDQREKLKSVGEDIRAGRPGLAGGLRPAESPAQPEPAAPPPPDQ